MNSQINPRIQEAAIELGLSVEEVEHLVSKGNAQSALASMPGAIAEEQRENHGRADPHPGGQFEEPDSRILHPGLLRPIHPDPDGKYGLEGRILAAMQCLGRQPTALRIGSFLNLPLGMLPARLELVNALNTLVQRGMLVQITEGVFSLPENAPSQKVPAHALDQGACRPSGSEPPAFSGDASRSRAERRRLMRKQRKQR